MSTRLHDQSPMTHWFTVCCSLFTAFLLAGLASRAGATEYFVATNGADTGNNGQGWDQPFKTISNAVAKATNANDIVTVSNGTYNIGAEILLSTNIRVRSLQGGLSGAANTVVKQTAASTRVFRTAHTNAVIEGLTITGGNVGGGQGGGVYMAGGLVRDCIVSNNLAPSGAGTGGNIFMDSTGSTVSNCIITAGAAGGRAATPTQGGSGIFANGNNKILYCQIIKNVPTDGYSMAAGILAQSTDLIRNCLIAGNSHNAHNSDPNAGYGAGIYGGKVESCTIVSNTCSYGKPGVVYNCAYVSNSIVYGNYAWGDDAGTFKITANYSGGSFAYSCATPLPAGAGNTAVEPKFVNAAGGDYRLLFGPQVDKGSNQTWMAGALDLAGNPRTNGVNNIVDMGAYEYVPGALVCALVADVTSVMAPSNVVFTAFVGGTNTSLSSYTWDFGDGNTTNGSALAVVTNTYGAVGLYTVTLTVTNTANEAAACTNANYISVWGSTVYVWTNSPSPMAPYDTWTKAAHQIQDVVGNINTPAGVTNCWVTNGTYNIVSELVLSTPIRVHSVQSGLSGASNTIVKQTVTGNRVFRTAHANAVIEGLTITGGNAGAGQGGGVYMAGGLVRDCIVSNNLAPFGTGTGGNIYMNSTGSTVSNCIITAGQAGGRTPTSAGGSGIFAGGNNTILNCQIINNNSSGSGYSMAPGILAQPTDLIRNCLIAGNYLPASAAETYSGYGGGVYGGKVESCTIVSNTSAYGRGPGGVYNCAYVSNSIVYGNYAWGDSGGTFKIATNHSGTPFAYSCTVPTNGLTGAGNIDLDPRFVGSGNYQLQKGSPCINAGNPVTDSWMIDATDLAGAPRVQNKRVDMGAYETLVPSQGSLILMR